LEEASLKKRKRVNVYHISAHTMEHFQKIYKLKRYIISSEPYRIVIMNIGLEG